MEYKFDEATRRLTPLVRAPRVGHAHLGAAFEVKSIGADGTFAGYASVFDVVDSQQDMVKPGAFKNSLTKRRDPVQLLWQHQWESPIGIVESLFEDAHGLFIRGRLLLDVAQAHEAYVLLKAGALRGLSIGYRVKRAERDPATGVRLLTEIDLFEISLVTFPANDAAQVTVVKSAHAQDGLSHLLDRLDYAFCALSDAMR